MSLVLVTGLAACGSGDDADAGPQAVVAPVAAPAGQSWTETVSITEEGGWKMGNPDAPIELVEYGSNTCPACAAVSTEGMETLLGDYVSSGRVNFEFRSVPLHGAIDLAITRLMTCAPKEAAIPLAEQVWGNLEEVITPLQNNEAALQQAMTLPENQRMVAFAQAAGLLDFFSARGISVDQARQCLSDFPAIEQLATRLDEQNKKDDIQGTPTFFLNGRRLGSLRWAEVEANLQNAGAR